MAYLKAEEIEQRKREGKPTNRIDCGWRLSPQTTARVANLLASWNPKTPTEKRDKHILELAFIQDMNAAQIARLKDPIIIGLGNRNNGKPLTSEWIWKICIKYVPEANKAKPDKKRRKGDKQRIELLNDRKAGKLRKPRVCCTCGSTEKTELHHIIPLAQGGTNDYFNLVYLCHDCHTKLHSMVYRNLKFLSP